MRRCPPKAWLRPSAAAYSARAAAGREAEPRTPPRGARLLPSRILRGAAGLATAALVLATPLSALAQAPADLSVLVPGVDAAGAGWALQLTAGDATNWVSVFNPTDATDKSSITAGVKAFPNADAVKKDFDDATRSLGKVGYKVEEVQGIGDRAVRVSGSVGSKKTAESFYIFSFGTTMGGVTAESTPAKFADVDAAAVKVANAELALVRSGGQGNTPAQATPGGLAKAVALPYAAVAGDGWAVGNESLDPAGKAYSIDLTANDGTNWSASIATYVAESSDEVDSIMNKSVDNLKAKGWQLELQDTYGDHPGLKGVLKGDAGTGVMYAMGVGNKVAMVLVVAPNADAQAAADYADGLAAAQEGRLY